MFYQRDDMMALYDAINNYVTKYVNLYYDSSQKIESDVEIQNFGQELVKGKSKGGCGLVGVPFKDEKFSTPDQLILVFTCAIFTSSVVHAAANFSQYDAYGFPPNYPLKLKGAPPKNKDQMKEEDIIKCLADKSSILDTMVITTILSERTNNALGDFEVTYTYDPAAVDIVEEYEYSLLHYVSDFYPP
uniref:Lipoxygenase domain-containing protein n=1 Tax=Magallana gigas TaxID=29159 RepID=A0A8W8HT47_MAGGI